MTGPRILFVVDAGPEVGGGHVMRSLTLARALEPKGASFAFLAPPPVSSSTPRSSDTNTSGCLPRRASIRTS